MKSESGGATVIPISSCERCKELERRLEVLQAERDELVIAVARERQRANAVLVQFPTAPVMVPAPVAVADPPLRHRIADRINDSVKRLLPFAHTAAKRLTSKNG
jgi:hypothetical protein